MSVESNTAQPKISFWNDPKSRSVFAQLLLVLAVIAIGYELYSNASVNLAKLGKTFGYEFWNQSAGFDILQSLIPYDNASSYGTAILVGFLNTLLVAILGIILATTIGFIAGIARLSKNWLVAKIATVYVETIRNIPLLLQLFIWYKVVLGAVPDHKSAWNFADAFYISKKGVNLPAPIFGEGANLIWIGLASGILAAFLIRRWAIARQTNTGLAFPYIWAGFAALIILPIIALALAGWPLTFDYPTRGAFRFTGGATIVPEFIALFVGLSVYTGSFITEIVRSGIQAVSHGQTEAASALGLRSNHVTRLVVIPQAMRIIIPPLASQFLNLTKNSSLAVAIAYPDFVAIGGTVINQTGKAIEVVLIWMVVYLALSLLTSSFMNWFNNRMKLVER